jgi:hypothetical protein
MYAFNADGWTVVPDNTKLQDLPQGYSLSKNLPQELLDNYLKEVEERFTGNKEE